MKTNRLFNQVRSTYSRLTVLALLLTMSAGGCDWLSSNDRGTVVLGELVEIEHGRTVLLAPHGQFLTFKDVIEDSRCPSGVDCVWEGVAKAAFRLVSTEGDTTFTLSIPGLVTTPYEDGESVTVHGLEFTLLDLSPYPVYGVDIDSTEYRALLRVESDESAR